MSFSGKFEIDITVATQEELRKISEAIFSGYAEHILKEHILYGGYSAVAAPSVPQNQRVVQEPEPVVPSRSYPKQSTPDVELKRIDTPIGEIKSVHVEEKHDRPTGILGRGRMGRSSK